MVWQCLGVDLAWVGSNVWVWIWLGLSDCACALGLGLADCGFGLVEEVLCGISLKVPKRENFSLAFFAQSEPTWVCDLGSGEKNRVFLSNDPCFRWFLVFCRILSVR